MNIEKEITVRLSENQNLKKIKQFIKNNIPFVITGHEGFFKAFLINKIKEYSKENKVILIVKNENISSELKNDLMQITDQIYELNYFNSLTYKGISSKSKIFSERVKFLINFYENNSGIYIVSLKSLLSKIPTKENLFNNIYKIHTGKIINIENLEINLIKLGYEKTTRVALPGEFTIKGTTIDLYPFNKAQPIRISMHVDKIEEIKYFNPLTQLKQENEILEFDIIPTKEIIWNNESINILKQHIKENEYKKLFEQIQTKYNVRAEEMFYPLIGNTYLSQEINADIITINFEIPNLQAEIKNIYKEYEKLYNQAIETGEKTIAPKKIFTNLNNLRLKTHILFAKTPAPTKTEEIIEFKIESECKCFSNIALAKEKIQNWLNNGFKVIIAAESNSQKEKLKYIFKELHQIKIEVLKISSSLIINKEKIAIILESDIFNRIQKTNKAFESSKTKTIDSFIEIEKNSHIVHINHGIGIFRKIKRIKTSLLEKDYIEIEYADNEKLFIPIEQTHLIQRYIGNETQNIKLDKISSKTWEKKKAYAKKRIDAIADKLVSLYLERESTKGFQYPQDDEWQLLFEAEFPYNETPDQLTAISEIKQDMMSPKVMDRLLCGDVGFGKTEVAMRAAFKAVMGKKQVAILSPTTILTEQHFNTFKKRFKNFPVKIAMISRFIGKSKEREIIKNLETGEIDIIIGTHKILSKKIIYKNLGLIIIDEEQRFGVREKERLKEIKVSIDCLSLSATPIPRSLHMSLIKLRDISVLKTPPQNRIKIETYVEEFNELLIKHAIENELSRDGQVFFVHHNIQELDSIKAILEKVVPYARIATIHAKLTGEQIENIMHDFINKSYQVLLATTIIENGIDIENANTIIINNANRFGLAQLYQLRGRVGRSSQKAFAYFLYKENSSLNEGAIERLKAISELSELGAGFQIAMKDMEIRGVGNLLGREQHGEIESIGLDYYLTMLNKAIEKRMGKNSKEDKITIEINYNGFIPDSYINSEQDKISIYKKIAAIQNEEENNKIRSEIYDRFGPIPKELNTLLMLSELKLLVKKLNIASLKERNGLLEIEYLNTSSIPVTKIIQIIKYNPTIMKINPEYKNSVFLNLKNVKESEKIKCIYKNLNLLL
ncbi:transcription-repair coupling factor [Borrelia anserina]|uniref:Transcription-repair-coupling factor n=2 Tax=Borrelia anserina TaxID=143 RepID=W5SN37_BORAN|nr:transcription-repair coupling factor [Borrelia anserina]AHH08594.1 Transcription-repair coupling factor [Borrelia anserina BA2]APR65058.1 transcription-repair coupling factor [Borrelia anserina Es]UPA06984.1 transcription-repair coupling factor [Borrelia anserina]